MFLIRMSVWGERLQKVLLVCGIVLICSVCAALSVITYQLSQPLSVVECDDFVAKVVEIVTEHGPQRELVVEVQKYVSPNVFETNQYPGLIGFPHKSVGKLIGECKGNKVTFAAENIDGSWDSYQVCLGQRCSDEERKPVRINIG